MSSFIAETDRKRAILWSSDAFLKGANHLKISYYLDDVHEDTLLLLKVNKEFGELYTTEMSIKTVARALSLKRDKGITIKPGPKKTLNIVTVGDGDTGKTCLLMKFKGRPFPGNYVPTVFETYTRDIRIEGETITLGLWDTAGQEGYDRLRPLAYPHCDCFVICYAVDSPDSLYNVKEKWLPELEHFCPNVPRILVATKKDIRRRTLAIMDILNGNKAPKIVSYEEGLCTAAMIGASRFLETSALCNDGVREVFEQTARVALEAREKRNETKTKKKNESCRIL